MAFRLSALVLALSVAGCAPRKLPGTDIDDTSDTRAILDIVSAYQKAVEHRSAPDLVALVDPTFKDDGGSANPDDDLEYRTLTQQLNQRFAKIQDVRLDVNVRRIQFDEPNTKAVVTYSYTLSFRMPDYTQKTQSENDLKQMTLKRVGEKQWKIVSGI